MQQTNLIPHGHADLITHLVYDFYGERLATCSADQKIKLFRKNPEGSWESEADWKAHEAPVIRLSFAHPSHGSLLASCSHDRTLRIWEEPSSSTSGGSSGSGGNALGIAGGNPVGQGSSKDGNRWLERAVLTGAKGSVRSVEFGCPNPGMGLRVASIATDSHLRIHTSLDPNLTDWILSQDIYIPSIPPPGSTDELTSSEGANGTAELAAGGWGLSWCKEKWWGSVLAVFTGTNPVVKIISIDPTPTSLLFLTPPTNTSTSPLTSLSWAPSCGRSYHLIATGSRDGTVRIWKITPKESSDSEKEWKGEVVADFGKGARVSMVDWNVTGTTLTVADDEGIIRIYKATYAKEWKLMGKMTAEEPSEDANGH